MAAAIPPLFFVLTFHSTITSQSTSFTLSSHFDLPQTAKRSNRRTTKIVAITDVSYAPIALDWHRRLTSLGYPPHQAVVVAADDPTFFYFSSANITVEPMLHPESEGWPVADPALRDQTRRRRIFASRWIYVLHQLKNGYSVLLTDADNIFVRYMDTRELENSGYDVIHAYCHNFPVEFLSMGFVVCGGMMWLKGNGYADANGLDGLAVKYVESILEQCGWSVIGNDALQEGNHSSQESSTSYYNVSNIHPLPLKAPAAYCDDQHVINSKFFSNPSNYLWETKPQDGFWKNEASGISLDTKHKFKMWDVNTAYRGPVDGYHDEDNVNNITSSKGVVGKKQCPDISKSWVAMP